MYQSLMYKKQNKLILFYILIIIISYSKTQLKAIITAQRFKNVCLVCFIETSKFFLVIYDLNTLKLQHLVFKFKIPKK